VFFVQEIDVVQEFMNMQESLNKDWKKQPAIVMQQQYLVAICLVFKP